jgi:hypothetical protein
MSHTCGNILLHLIFSTRERRPLMRPEFRNDLFAYLGGIVREMGGTALIVRVPRIMFTCSCESGRHSRRRKLLAS